MMFKIIMQLTLLNFCMTNDAMKINICYKSVCIYIYSKCIGQLIGLSSPGPTLNSIHFTINYSIELPSSNGSESYKNELDIPDYNR